MMQFSFIIPVYNCIDCLETCVKSVLDISGYAPDIEYEVLLVDDGSTDGSTQLCDRISMENRKDVCIRVHHQANRGVSAARNAGLALAAGKYVIFIDSDDTVDSQAIGKVLEQMQKEPELDMAVYGISFDYYIDGKCFRRDEVLPPFSGVIEKTGWETEFKSLFETNVLSALWNKVIKKSILIENKIRLKEDMIILEDLEISLQIMKYCNQILYVQKPVYHYVHIGHEDHAGKRLQRIAHLNHVMDKIASAISAFMQGEGKKEIEKQKKEVLLMIYRNLAVDKIKLSPLQEIQTICADFKYWVDDTGILQDMERNKFFMQLYENKAWRLFFRSRYSNVRHVLANLVKLYIGDFRKWLR